MKRKHCKALVCQFLVAVMAFTTTFTNGAYAQASIGDFEIPTITSAAKLIESANEGGYDFEISVTDNVAVAKVTLHYRYSDSGSYAVADLPLKSNERYGVTLASHNDEIINYYVTAEDTSGNATRRGNSFFPIVAELSGTASDGGAFGQSKTLYYLLGVLAIGALAGLAGGSSGGGSEESDTTCCTVTITTTPQ